MTPQRVGSRLLLATMIVAISTISLAAAGSALAASIAHRPTTLRPSHAVPRWPAPRQILVFRHLHRNEPYTIRVSVRGNAARPSHIRIAVGRRVLHAVTTRRHQTAVVTTRIRPTRRFIVIIVAYPAHRRMRVHASVGSIRLPLRNVVLHERVAEPGLYAVRIVVASRSRTRSRIRLTIGRLYRYAFTTRRRRHVIVRARVSVAGAMLTVSARGRFRARLSVALHAIVAVRRVSGASGSSGVSNVAPVVPAASQASAVGAVPAAPAGLPGSWHLAFDDEFNGSSLDTSKWSTGWFGSGITGGILASEPECYDPSHVVQSNGELDLNLTATPESCDGSTHPYASGMVTTNGKFSFTYGYIEVRAWLPATSSGQIADWPGIWTDGQNWPSTGELDILEGLGGQACAHWHGPTANGAGYGANGGTGCPPGTFTGGWHTFAADWEPGIVTWYYDGQNIGCIETSGSTCGNYNTTITSNPMYLILALGSDAANTITAPASQRTDYVRVYQH